MNRALLPYLFGAIEAVNDGANPDMLDQALVAFGMPMGPIELCDQVGLDVCLNAGEVIGISEESAQTLRSMIETGKLGRKSGSGFYEWDGKKAVRARGNYDQAELAAIASGLLTPLVGECRSAVAEGVVEMRTWPTPPVFSESASRPSAAARCSGMKAVLNDRQ